jgi:hypothetical protein
MDGAGFPSFTDDGSLSSAVLESRDMPQLVAATMPPETVEIRGEVIAILYNPAAATSTAVRDRYS